MADGLDLNDIVRRTVQANARLYKGWVDLSLEYFRGIADIFGGVPETAASPAEEPDGGAGAVVLEEEAGKAATAAFLVTNDLDRKLECRLVAGPFQDSDGKAGRATVTFEPAAFALAPGQQSVVRVTAPIDSKLAAGVAYTGEIGIEGMDGLTVPVVLRRRHAVELSPIDRVAEGQAHTTGRTAKARKTASRKKTAAKKSTARKATARKGARKKSTARKKTRKKTARKKTARKKTPNS
jgi:hypothetical protein